MSADAAAVTAAETGAETSGVASGEAAAPPRIAGGRGRLALLAAAAVSLCAGGGLWFGGWLPDWLGVPRDRAASVAAPVLIDVPDMVTNMNAAGRRPVFLKLRAKVEAAPADAAAVVAQMPRIVDLFQTLLRELRPEELRGSAGTHRLKEELVARANIAIAPARVTDVLFVEMLVQ